MSLKEKLTEIDQLQQTIEKHGRLNTDVLKKVNYKFRLEWNYYSNRMEGNTLTMEETKTVMVNLLDIHGKSLKDVLEMKGHDDAIRKILQIGKGELNISEARIKDLHTNIMYGEGEETKEKIGKWKTVNNHIFNPRGEKFDFTDWNDVATEMHELINWINAEKEKIQRKSTKATHPVLLAFQFHLKYLTIHPFYDGNGRTARILTNLILISYGFPPVYIKDGEEKDKYYTYLSETQGYGADENLLFGLLCDYLIRSLNIVLNAAEGKEIDEPDDIDKRIALLTKELAVKQVANTIKSDETLYNQLKNGIFPLFEEIEAKLEKLKPLFLNFSKDTSFQGNSNPIQIASKESRWEQVAVDWLENTFHPAITTNPFNPNHSPQSNHKIAQNEIIFNKLVYNFGLFGFKSSLEHQNFGFNIQFQFDEYSYSLKINSANAQTFSYDNPLSKDQRNKIVKIIMDELLERIEAATK